MSPDNFSARWPQQQPDPWLEPSVPAGTTPLALTGPPLGHLALSAGCVIAASLLLLTARQEPWACALAWVLAGPVSIVVLGLFVGEDNRRRARSLYNDLGWPRPLAKSLLVLGVLLSACASWFFADWVARL